MGLALAHPEPAPVHHVERIRFQGDQDTQQPIFRRGQRRVLLRRVPAGGARLPIEAPSGHMGLEHALKDRDQPPKLVQRQTGQIQDLRGAGLDVGEP